MLSATQKPGKGKRVSRGSRWRNGDEFRAEEGREKASKIRKIKTKGGREWDYRSMGKRGLSLLAAKGEGGRHQKSNKDGRGIEVCRKVTCFDTPIIRS